MNFRFLSVFASGLVLTGANSNVIGVTARGGIDDQVRSVNLRQLPQLKLSGLGDDSNFEKFNFEDNAWTYRAVTNYQNSYGDPNWKDCAQYNCFLPEGTIGDFIYYFHGFKNYGEGIMVWMTKFASGFSYAERTLGVFQDTIEHSKLGLKGDHDFWFNFKSSMGRMVKFFEQYATRGWTGPVKVEFFYKWNGFDNIYSVNAFRRSDPEPPVPTPVIDALKKIDQNRPLIIQYVGEDQDASHDLVQIVLQTALTARDKTIFSPEVVKNITFKGQLTVGGRAKVIATYNGENVVIDVQEGSKPTPVIDALKKITQTNPLKIKYVNDQDSNHPAATNALRVALTARDKTIFSLEVVINITFKGQLTVGGRAKDIATYNGENVVIDVQEGSKPTPVIDALKKITQTNLLKIKYVNDQDSNHPAATNALRVALTARDKTIFTKTVVEKINFQGMLKSGSQTDIAAIYHKKLVSIFVQERQENPVLIALKRFNQSNPVKSEYISSQLVSVRSPELTRALRRALVRSDQTHSITSTNVQNITFSQAELKPSLSASKPQMLQANYLGNSVPIFAYEAYPTPDNIQNVLAKFRHDPLDLGVLTEWFLGQIINKIRTKMIAKAKSKYITKLVVKEIGFPSGLRLIPKGWFKVWSLSLVYQGLKIKIFIRTCRI